MDVLHRKGGVIRPEVSPYGFIRIYFIEDDLLEMQYYHIKASAFLSNAFPSKDIVWRMFWVVAIYVFSSEFQTSSVLDRLGELFTAHERLRYIFLRKCVTTENFTDIVYQAYSQYVLVDIKYKLEASFAGCDQIHIK